MSYEYYGYNYIADEPVKNADYPQDVYVYQDSYIRDNVTYKNCLDAIDSWKKHLNNRSSIYIGALLITLNIMLKEEIGERLLEHEDISIFGRYAYIPAFDKMVEIPPLIALETVLELYKL